MNIKAARIARIIFGSLLVVAIIFVVNILFSTSGGGRPVGGYPVGSTYSADFDGAELLYRLLESTGFDVVRHRKPLIEEEMPDDGTGIIWHVSGEVPVDEDELAFIDHWVYRGGTLVLIDNPPEMEDILMDPVGEVSGDSLIAVYADYFDLVGVQREITPLGGAQGGSPNTHYLTVGTTQNWGLGWISSIHSYLKRGLVNPVVYRFVELDEAQGRRLFAIRDGYGIVISSTEYGDGHVWMVADPYIFGNMLIQEADNAVAALSMLAGERSGGVGRVLFDEYHLGFVQTRSLEDAAKTPLGRAIIWFGLIGILAIGTAGARFGPVRKPRSATGVSQRAFVSALAEMWQGAGATGAVAEALWKRYSSRQDVRRKGLDKKLESMRGEKPRIEELIEISKKLDG